MNYFYCDSCRKRTGIKNKKSHFNLELHMINEKAVINKYTIMNPELCQINDILKAHVTTYNRRFENYTVVCKWKLVFDYDISVNVKSKLIYRFRAFHQNREKNLKNKINRYKLEGLEFSHISEMNIFFKTRLDQMTYKHYIEQPLPKIERLFNKRLYKNFKLIKSLNDIDLTLQMGANETGKADLVYYSDED